MLNAMKTIPVGILGTNCYVVWCKDSETVYVIDPGAGAEEIANAVNAFPFRSVRILLTHAHFDHIGAAGALARKFQVKAVELDPADHPIYRSQENAMPPFALPVKDLPEVSGFAPSEDFLRLSLPGHSPGGSGFLFALPEGGKALFSGDTLFAGSVGRTDLWGGDEEALLDSIRNTLLTLPDDTEVYPGHGESTTIGIERRTNPWN